MGDRIKKIFPGPMGKVVVSTSTGVMLYDTASKKAIGKVKPKNLAVKNTIWSKNFTKLAIISRTYITFVDKTFNFLFETKIFEPLLSGYFNESDTFMYSTHYHVKYIINKDSCGIIATLNERGYLVAILGSTLYYVNQKGSLTTMKVDLSEYNYKLGITRGRIGEVINQLSKGEIIGSLSIRYLEQQGLPEIALNYEKDEKHKFSLAKASGNLEAALEAALQLKRRDCLSELAEEAMKQGNTKVAETCYQKMLSFDKLVFLYILLGDFQKLEKIMNLAKTKLKDQMLEYQTAMVIGRVESQVKLLAEAGHLPLAYAIAKKHKLESLIPPLIEAIKNDPQMNQEILEVNLEEEE
jgi:coatomer protein complex subunit alpha (xenin)